MNEAKAFGVPRGAEQLDFEARYKGPVGILKQNGGVVELAAVHQAGEASLDLTSSVQVFQVDTSVIPHTINGTASFYTKDGQDFLLATFSGVSSPKEDTPSVEEAVVFVIFNGGTGRFARATGTATVEADLHLSEGFSEGQLVGSVIIPTDT